MYHDCSEFWKDLIRTGLQDDDWLSDWTAIGTVKSGRVRARLVAKSDGVWAAAGLLEALKELEPGFELNSSLKSGDQFKKGAILCEWTGPARKVLAYERPMINLASYVSGIATATHALVETVRKACPNRPPRVTSTRKTLPGYRDLAVLGVQAGGGHAHRVSLSGGVLIKENHIAAAGSIAAALSGVRAVAPHGLKIEIEVRDLKELDEALAGGAEAVLLDNFSPELVRKALDRLTRVPVRPVVEVSGGINASNIAQYALEGIDVVSVGSLTHSVRSVDLSLLLDDVRGL